MGRYTGPTERISRRIGVNIFDKLRSAIEKDWRATPPGMHGFRRGRPSDFGRRLVEKQKVKYYYGVRERQFIRYFAKAARMKGNTGENLLSLLERRLDSAIFRAGLATTHRQARQMVVHGHVEVNGRKVDRPSFSVSVGDELKIRQKEKSQKLGKLIQDDGRLIGAAAWLEADAANLTAKVIALPKREDVTIPLDENLVVESLSR